jgi:drug/metabolite transporter (DMT)-like permease
MHQRLSPAALFFLVIPPMLWAGNAVVGRMVGPLVPPMAFNLMRWSLAFVLLLPFAWRVLQPGAPLWRQWRRFAVLGLLGTSGYNALNYLALHTSSAINVTLVGASTPVWMLLIGRLFFGQRIAARQLLGAALSILGVLLVLSRGEWAVLVQFRLVPGDFYVLVASVGWAVYCWMLMHPTPESAAVNTGWRAFLVAQIVFGLLWSTLFTTTESLLVPAPVHWGWPLAAALAYVAIGPSIIAYGSFGAGLQRAGPHVAAHFINLTPLFTALLSAVFLDEPPTVFHALAFVLIVLGIALSRGSAQAPEQAPEAALQ